MNLSLVGSCLSTYLKYLCVQFWNFPAGFVCSYALYGILDVIYYFITQCNNNDHRAAEAFFHGHEAYKSPHCWRRGATTSKMHDNAPTIKEKWNSTNLQANECRVCHEKRLGNVSCSIIHWLYHKFFLSSSYDGVSSAQVLLLEMLLYVFSLQTLQHYFFHVLLLIKKRRIINKKGTRQKRKG